MPPTHKLRDTVGHPYSRDTSNQGTQNLVPEKCSHHLCSCYYLYYFKRHLYSAVPKPTFNLHSGDTLALETQLNTKISDNFHWSQWQQLSKHELPHSKQCTGLMGIQHTTMQRSVNHNNLNVIQLLKIKTVADCEAE